MREKKSSQQVASIVKISTPWQCKAKALAWLKETIQTECKQECTSKNSWVNEAHFVVFDTFRAHKKVKNEDQSYAPFYFFLHTIPFMTLEFFQFVNNFLCIFVSISIFIFIFLYSSGIFGVLHYYLYIYLS